MAASKSPKVSIKLLIDPASNRVVLAEVGYDFVDTLRSLLTFPLGNIARLVAKHRSLHPGCLNKLYNSVENLGLNSFRTDVCKRMLLSPRRRSAHEDNKSKNLKLSMVMDIAEPLRYFVCKNCYSTGKAVGSLSYYSETITCTCGELMNYGISFKGHENDVAKDETEGGLYNVESMFFITDDLRVMRGLPGGLVNFLLGLGIKNVSKIEEEVLEIGSKEMSNLLSHAIVSKTALTDVFMRKQGALSSGPMLDEQRLMPEASSGKISVTIMLRKSDRKILYAEGSEDFVDLIFSFLTIPLESVLELVGGKGNVEVGSLWNLFRDLDTIFSITKQKNYRKGVLPPFFSCPNEFPSIRSQDPYATFHRGLNLWHLDPKSPKPNTTNSSGYVKKKSLFVVTDDLVVKSLSSVSSISLLKEMGTPLDDVEQQVISIGKVEALALLRSCLCSSSALSDSLNVYVKQPKQEAKQDGFLVAMSRIWECYGPIFKIFQLSFT